MVLLECGRVVGMGSDYNSVGFFCGVHIPLAVICPLACLSVSMFVCLFVNLCL